ncbi:MAG: hypothetical protein Q8M07_22110 [Prosthecobacter sp.]|nr:hypothetical protein [Prosthecobacter sp.]
MNLLQPLRFVLPVLLLTTLASCSSDFRAAWKKAPVTEAVEGKWAGTWQSTANGHHGKLRCLVGRARKTIASTDYHVDHEFFYHATWKSILSGSYKAIHQVVKKKDGTYSFKGSHQMPDWAGGKYHYEGTIKGDDFNACYESAMDRGTYTMKRVH